jgi:uncharacterized protein (TIGR03435 family)
MRVIAAMLVVYGCAAAANGQTAPGASAAFDAASIKPNRIGGRTTVEMGGGRFSATNVTLRVLLGLAYPADGRLRNDDQVAGGPAWVYSDRFDVFATGAPRSLGAPAAGAIAPPESAALNELRAMVRNLLASRFQVIVHNENRELAAYALVRLRADSLGPQLRPSNADCAAERGMRRVPPGGPGPAHCARSHHADAGLAGIRAASRKTSRRRPFRPDRNLRCRFDVESRAGHRGRRHRYAGAGRSRLDFHRRTAAAWPGTGRGDADDRRAGDRSR